MIKIWPFSFLSKVFRSVRASLLFEEAWDQLAQKNNKKAEEIFEKSERILSDGQMAYNLPYEYKLMKGYIKFRLEKRKECYDLLKNAWYDIEDSKLISDPDKIYLKEYIFGIIKIYKDFYRLYGIEIFRLISFVELIYPEDIPLNEMSRQWKKRFPCRDHPNWDKYGV